MLEINYVFFQIMVGCLGSLVGMEQRFLWCVVEEIYFLFFNFCFFYIVVLRVMWYNLYMIYRKYGGVVFIQFVVLIFFEYELMKLCNC